MHQVEEVTNAAAWAAQLEGRGTGSFRALTVSVTARLPIDQVAAVDGMAKHAGTSRTYALSQVLAAGFEALDRELDAGTRTALRKLQAKRMKELVADATDAEER